ncbi:MAG TPA: Ig-like domain-containing protein, partial [Isosphaeraceae bacterium]
GLVAVNTPGLLVRGNAIGTDRAGTVPLSNGGAGATITVSPGVTIGGPTAGDGNVISGNRGGGLIFSDSPDVRVQGNAIGTDRAGVSAAVGNGGVGLEIVNQVGSTAPAGVILSNVISGNAADGVRATNAPGLVVRSNAIGTDRTGTQVLGNAGVGLTINGSAGATVGGTAAGEGNVISGNRGGGLVLSGSPGTQVQGNVIGTDRAATTPLGNGGVGVRVDASPATAIGGTAAGAGNVVAFNVGAGVVVASGPGISILGNAISANGGLGIDLGADGVTPNDPGDADGGANDRQNFPALTAITVITSNQFRLDAALSSRPNRSYLVQYYVSGGADPSGFGEGQTLLGSQTVTTDGRGVASFTTPVFTASLPANAVFSATATDTATGETSEFSRANDLNAPTVTLASPAPDPTNTAPIPVTVTFSKPVTGFDAGDLMLVNASVTQIIGAGAFYSFELRPIDQGPVSVSVLAGAAEDSAGNPSVASTPLRRTFDTVGPTATLASPVRGPTTIMRIPVTVTFTEVVTELLEVDDLILVNATATPPVGRVPGLSFSFDLIPSGPGDVSVFIKAGAVRDVAGNPSLASDPFSIAVFASTSPLVVTNTQDAGDGSLRRAIELANARPGPDTIRFNISGAGVQTIIPLSPLPTILEPVTIDGFSQPGALPNTRADDNNAVLLIQLSAPQGGAVADGLTFGQDANQSIVQGLVINQFRGAGIILNRVRGARIAGNFIGTTA